MKFSPRPTILFEEAMEQTREGLLLAEADSRPDFEQVYRNWFPHVVRWARALGGPTSDLDDVAQEVFVVVQRKIVSFDGENLPAWLFHITTKKVSEQRRRAWFRRVFSRPDPDALSLLSSTGDPSADLERKRRQETLYRILDRISDKHRAVFVLFEVEEYSGEQISQILDVPLATVWTRLHHARKQLARLAAEEVGA
jgi:RNA polymerase sigma-70 factor (ECF subfamily)